MKRKPPGQSLGQPGARFGQNGNYLSELEAQPGGPEGRPHTTAGSWPIAITGRPQGVRPRSLNSDHAVSPDLPEIRREHPVPSPVSFSRTDSSPEAQRSGAAGVLLGYESSCFNHARYDTLNRLATAKKSNHLLAVVGTKLYIRRIRQPDRRGRPREWADDSVGELRRQQSCRRRGCQRKSGVGSGAFDGTSAAATYDVENRLVAVGGVAYYAYAPGRAVASLAGYQERALDQFHRLHGGVHPVRRGLLFLPQCRLRFVAVPGSFSPATCA